MITSLSWTWEYIDESMTIPRLKALTEHWKQFRPVHISAANFMGTSKPKEKQFEPPEFAQLPDLEE